MPPPDDSFWHCSAPIETRGAYLRADSPNHDKRHFSGEVVLGVAASRKPNPFIPEYMSLEETKMKLHTRRTIFSSIASLVLMLNLGVEGVYAQQNPVKMHYSGSNVATTINLQDGTVTDEELFAGNGALGAFTYRELHADTDSPQPSSTCFSGPYFLVVAGAGVFRFQDGSLMTVNVTEGAICVDLTTFLGHLTETYQITGGTGRFKGATGTLKLTGTLNVVLSDASGNNPKLLTNTGEFEGTVVGVAVAEDGQDQQQ